MTYFMQKIYNCTSVNHRLINDQSTVNHHKLLIDSCITVILLAKNLANGPDSSNISISLIKFFLNYFNINLLKRRVDSFKLITIENKFEIIKIVKYLTTPKNLGILSKFN